MDTRWRNSKRVRFLRGLMFLITFVSICLSSLKGQEFLKDHRYDLDVLTEYNYKNNQSYYEDRYNVFSLLQNLVLKYKNESNIKAGNLVTMEDIINNEKTPYYSEFVYQDQGYDEEKSDKENFEVFKKKYPNEVKKAEEDIIKTQIQDFNRTKDQLKKRKNVYYYATNGKDSYTNKELMKEGDYLKLPGYYMYDYDNGFRSYPRSSDNNYDSSRFYEDVLEGASSDIKIYIGYNNKYFEELENNWIVTKEKVLRSFHNFLIPFIVMLISFFFQIIFLPSMEEEGKTRLIDRIYTDLGLGLVVLIIFGYIVFIDNSLYKSPGFILSVTALLALPGLYFLMSLIRNIKNKRFFKQSIVFSFFNKFKSLFTGIVRGGSLEKRLTIFSIVYPAMIIFFIYTMGISNGVFPLLMAVFIIFFVSLWVLSKARDLSKIRDGVSRVKNGDLNHKIIIRRSGELQELSQDINSISEGLDKAIDNELRSERHRTELITNVSHDIRTPLTSIITYIDLLKDEKDEDKRKDYIEVLEKKSHRLKSLTDDLFEASKVSSGNIPVKMAKIDMLSLLTQGLGEMNDQIEAKDLEFVINSQAYETFVEADGELLWRAIENLITNIFKYGLEKSRVYVDFTEDDKYLIMTMKNISKYKLNISAEELMERFKRGDESRSSEGSGLGLSITESLVNLQNGSFKISIDGDLFKTKISLKKWKED